MLGVVLNDLIKRKFSFSENLLIHFVALSYGYPPSQSKESLNQTIPLPCFLKILPFITFLKNEEETKLLTLKDGLSYFHRYMFS